MKSINGIAVFGLLLTASQAFAQDYQRRATLRGGDPDRGKCTIEVVVDGVAEVEIRGDGANLRTLSGQPAIWRRFECSAPMPLNPFNFRFAGVDGRGRQQLVRAAGNGQPAVIRIEDPKNGSEGYTFDIFWERGGDRGPDRGFDRGPRFGGDDAVRLCREALTAQAADRFRTRRIEFRRIAIDNAAGRNEWVVGIMDVRRFDDRVEPFRFSCSVDFARGVVRSTQIDPLEGDFGRREGGGGAARAVTVCQDRVIARLRDEGWRRVEIRSIRVDDQPGRNDWVIGRASGERDGFRDLEFSCNVDLRDGDVRSVDVRPVGFRR